MTKTTGEKVTWDEDTKKNYDFLLSKIPIALRSTAKRMITPKAESIAREDGHGGFRKRHGRCFLCESSRFISRSYEKRYEGMQYRLDAIRSPRVNNQSVKIAINVQ